ncbi:hypothetical protein TNCV_263441 [Trichonephila clavipes]|nr:hypothetical protein TNCV_263441 [Trichonephila clavipes]
MARKRAENREGSLGFPGIVKPVFTKDSKTPREKEKITRAPRERETRTHLKKVAQAVQKTAAVLEDVEGSSSVWVDEDDMEITRVDIKENSV